MIFINALQGFVVGLLLILILLVEGLLSFLEVISEVLFECLLQRPSLKVLYGSFNLLKCLFDFFVRILLVVVDVRNKANIGKLVKHLGQPTNGWQDGVLLITLQDVPKEVFKKRLSLLNIPRSLVQVHESLRAVRHKIWLEV